MQSEADGQPCAAHYTAAEVIVYILMLTVADCSSIGPGTVTRDRLHYSCALSDSWKEQLLVNIVKTRYEDSPAFLELSSVVSGYTLETGLGASGQLLAAPRSSAIRSALKPGCGFPPLAHSHPAWWNRLPN